MFVCHCLFIIKSNFSFRKTRPIIISAYHKTYFVNNTHLTPSLSKAQPIKFIGWINKDQIQEEITANLATAFCSFTFLLLFHSGLLLLFLDYSERLNY